MGLRTLLRVSCVTSLDTARRSVARSACMSATALNWTCGAAQGGRWGVEIGRCAVVCEQSKARLGRRGAADG